MPCPFTRDEAIRLISTQSSTYVDTDDPLAILQLLIAKTYFMTTKRSVSSLNRFLMVNTIPTLEIDNENAYLQSLSALHECVSDLYGCVQLMRVLFPHLIIPSRITTEWKNSSLEILTILYVLVRESGSIGSPEDKLRVDYNAVYTRYETFFVKFGMDFGRFVDLWNEIHFFSAGEPHFSDSKYLDDAKAVYAKNGLSHNVLLNDYRNVYAEPETSGTYLRQAWQSPSRKQCIESGMTKEEVALNSAAWAIRKMKPTDVVHSLFYDRRTDYLIECSILFESICHELYTPESSSLLVVNPSPDLLLTFSSRPETRALNATFVVPDDTVKELYSKQFAPQRSYSFATFEELPRLQKAHRLIVFCARDSDPALFLSILDSCHTINAKLLAFIPQSFFTTQAVISGIQSSNYTIDRIVSLPNAMSQSAKRKKMLVHAHTNSMHPSGYFDLIFSSYHKEIDVRGKERYYMYLQQNTCQIPLSWISKRYTLAQMQRQYQALQSTKVDGTPKESYEEASVYAFSKEILIHYNVYPKERGRPILRACYRAILGKNASQTLGKRLTKNVERRYSTEDLEEELDGIVLNSLMTSAIIDEVESTYRNQPEELSLKTVWFCNRPELMVSLTYDDSFAVQVFCTADKALTDIAIGEITEDTIQEILESALPADIGKAKCIKLLKQVLRCAANRGFLSHNPLSHSIVHSSSALQDAMHDLRKALGKACLSFEEMQKMLAFLLEPIGSQMVPRAAKEPIWLVPLIRLCTGMPVREIVALQWKHFHKLGNLGKYQLYVVQHMNNSGNIVPLYTYKLATKFRKVPCASLLSNTLDQALINLCRQNQLSIQDVLDLPMIPSPKATKRNSFCPIHVARKTCSKALEKACIHPDVVTLLEGEASFEEDLNACCNDVYYSNFLHYCSQYCGMNAGQVSYICGKKGPDTFSNHYVDYGHDILQLAIIQKLDRLWSCLSIPSPSNRITNRFYSVPIGTDQTIYIDPVPSRLIAADIVITPIGGQQAGSISIHVASRHGVIAQISEYKNMQEEKS